MKRLLTLIFALIFAFLLTCSISSVMLGQDAAATTDATTAPTKVQTEHRKSAHSKARRQRIKTENGASGKREERTNGDMVERKESKTLKNGKVVTRKQKKHI